MTKGGATLHVIDRTAQKTQEWLKEMIQFTGRDDEIRAYQMLRAVLQVLRDRLTVDEAADLGAQLPLLIRGMFFEGWKPARQPVKLRTRDEFIQAVAQKLHGVPEISPTDAIDATFHVLNRRITGGEIEDIRRMLPQEIRNMWPEEPDVGPAETNQQAKARKRQAESQSED